MNHSKKSVSAFTLIELLAVLVLVVLLTNFSMANYEDHVKTGYRSEGKNALNQLSLAMEKHKEEKLTYANTHTSNIPNDDFFPSQIPIGAKTGEAVYDIKITSADASTYVIEAVPITNKIMEGDGTLTLNEQGVKTHDGVTGW